MILIFPTLSLNVEADIVAVPYPTAVATPFLTDITDGSLLSQSTSLSQALDGLTVAVRVIFSPIPISVFPALKLTEEGKVSVYGQ